jgi:hypothetical protein
MIAVAFLAWPVIQLWPLPGYMLAHQRLTSTNSAHDWVELGNSSHFRVVGPAGYMSGKEVAAFLTKTEARRARLVAFLGLPDDGRQVTVRLYPQEGVAYSPGPRSIFLYALKAGHTSVIHELTHSLMGYRNSFIAEGLAVVTEERFGWGMSFPNWLRPVDAHIYAGLRAKNGLLPLMDVWKGGNLWKPAEPGLSRLRYLQAGSFAQYLIKAYGLDTFLELYRSGSFERTYDRPLDELEDQWSRAIRLGHLGQALFLTLGGLGVLGLAHATRFQIWPWILATVVGLLAFFVWSYYLVYQLWIPCTLLLAIVIERLVSRRHRPWGVAMLWLVGIGSLAAFVLGPPIVEFVR